MELEQELNKLFGNKFVDRLGRFVVLENHRLATHDIAAMSIYKGE